VRFKESVFSQQVRASVILKSLWMSAHGSSVFSQQAEGPQTETQKPTHPPLRFWGGQRNQGDCIAWQLKRLAP
jgi:hypothetical protein